MVNAGKSAASRGLVGRDFVPGVPISAKGQPNQLGKVAPGWYYINPKSKRFNTYGIQHNGKKQKDNRQRLPYDPQAWLTERNINNPPTAADEYFPTFNPPADEGDIEVESCDPHGVMLDFDDITAPSPGRGPNPCPTTLPVLTQQHQDARAKYEAEFRARQDSWKMEISPQIPGVCNHFQSKAYYTQPFNRNRVDKKEGIKAGHRSSTPTCDCSNVRRREAQVNPSKVTLSDVEALANHQALHVNEFAKMMKKLRPVHPETIKPVTEGQTPDKYRKELEPLTIPKGWTKLHCHLVPKKRSYKAREKLQDNKGEYWGIEPESRTPLPPSKPSTLRSLPKTSKGPKVDRSRKNKEVFSQGSVPESSPQATTSTLPCKLSRSGRQVARPEEHAPVSSQGSIPTPAFSPSKKRKLLPDQSSNPFSKMRITSSGVVRQSTTQRMTAPQSAILQPTARAGTSQRPANQDQKWLVEYKEGHLSDLGLQRGVFVNDDTETPPNKYDRSGPDPKTGTKPPSWNWAIWTLLARAHPRMMTMDVIHKTIHEWIPVFPDDSHKERPSQTCSCALSRGFYVTETENGIPVWRLADLREKDAEEGDDGQKKKKKKGIRTEPQLAKKTKTAETNQEQSSETTSQQIAPEQQQSVQILPQQPIFEQAIDPQIMAQLSLAQQSSTPTGFDDVEMAKGDEYMEEEETNETEDTQMQDDDNIDKEYFEVEEKPTAPSLLSEPSSA